MDKAEQKAIDLKHQQRRDSAILSATERGAVKLHGQIVFPVYRFSQSDPVLEDYAAFIGGQMVALNA